MFHNSGFEEKHNTLFTLQKNNAMSDFKQYMILQLILCTILPIFFVSSVSAEAKIYGGGECLFFNNSTFNEARQRIRDYEWAEELFNNLFMRWWLDWLGAFAVNRESLSPSTIKTVMEIKKSKWVFGIFPQGTRGVPGTISNITKGFAGLAKITKCDVLPVGIVGTDEVKRIPFSGKIIVRIGKPIPYSDKPEEVVDKWIDAIQELTGFKYIPQDDDKDLGVKNNG